MGVRVQAIPASDAADEDGVESYEGNFDLFPPFDLPLPEIRRGVDAVGVAEPDSSLSESAPAK